MKREVPAGLDGERLDLVVARLLTVPRSRARALVDGGHVLLEGRPGLARERVARGDTLEIEEVEVAPSLEPAPVEFSVVFEDSDVLVVDKPAGLVVHPGAGTGPATLAAGLLHRYPDLEGVGDEGRWGIVHRLDRETSGLLIVARTPASHRALRTALAERRVHRSYRALVLGTFPVPTGTIDAPIGTDPARPTRRAVDPLGRPARTHFEVAAAWDPPGISLLDVTLETGRTHQIRVHFASIDHPVAGDRAYGRPGPVTTPRLFLHAARLAFDHPSSGELVEVESPLPADLAEVLERLGTGH